MTDNDTVAALFEANRLLQLIARVERLEREADALLQRGLGFEAECWIRSDRIEELERALGEWKCDVCQGEGGIGRYGSYKCNTCRGTGIHPIARAALAQSPGETK